MIIIMIIIIIIIIAIMQFSLHVAMCQIYIHCL